MPKTRKTKKSIGFSKQINKTNHVLRIKSGILSSNDVKVIQQDHLEFSFFDDELIHLDKEGSKKDYSYNDNRTILFNRKNVIPTLRLENNPYIYNNALASHEVYNDQKVLATPNIPSFYYQYGVSNDTEIGVLSDDVTLMDQTSDIYDRMLKEKYLKSETREFSEKTNWTDDLDSTIDENEYSYKKIISKDENYNTITIDYDLHKSPRPDLYLSFSKGENTRQVTFPDGTSYFTFNGNTAYFYNNDYTNSNFGPFDYLGNVSNYYNLNRENFLKSRICFNSISTYPFAYPLTHPLTKWGGVPIDTFGFPYSSNFDAFPRHLIPAKNYITKPFVIEKVCLEFKMSNWSVINDSLGDKMPCINFVNFFLLNQRGKINSNKLNTSRVVRGRDETGEVNVTLNNILDTNPTLFTTNNKSSNGTYSAAEIMLMDAGVTLSVKEDKIPGVDDQIEKNTKNQQRDMITTISVANYSHNPDSETYTPNINKDKIKKIVDVFVDESNSSLRHSSSKSECIYYDRKFKITSPVKHFYKNKMLPFFSDFTIYPEKFDSSRTNLDVSSKRSLSGENLNNIGSKSFFNGDFGNSTQINEFDYKESKYILNPEDNLVLGVTLSDGFLNVDYTPNQTFVQGPHAGAKDLVKISCSEDYPLKLHLIGYYLEDENKKVIVNKTTKQFKNTKRIGYYQNEVVDQIGSNLGYLEQNFYDRDVIARAGETITKKINSNKNKSRLGNKFELPNLNQSEFNDTGFTSLLLYYNGLSFKKDHYKLSESSTTVYLLKHYYNKYRFGMFFDKLNHNRIHQFIDAKYQNISKRFMKGFYKQKTLGTVSGKLIFDFSRLNEFKGNNFLKEKIMTSTTGKSAAQSALTFTIKDNQQNSVNFLFLTDSTIGQQNLAPQALSNSDIYLNLNNEDIVLSEIDSNISNAFTKTNNLYPANLETNKRAFVDAIVSAINAVDNKPQQEYDSSNLTGITKDFKLKVTAEVVLSTLSSDKVEVKITLNRKGSLGNPKAVLSSSDMNFGVSIEDFALEEGDLLNSYNITSNALYSDSDVAFKDS